MSSGSIKQLDVLIRAHLVAPLIPFPDVLAVLRDLLEPVHSACLEERGFSAEWSPALLRWVSVE